MPYRSSRSSQFSYPPQAGPQPARRGRPLPPRPAPNPSPRRPPTGQFVMAGGGMLALAAMLITPNLQPDSTTKADICQQPVQPQSFLSRDKLSELLEVPERSSKERVQEVIAEPYCIMASSSYREGVEARREAYPLEFDPDTWLIVLYEGDEYAGYDFSFRR